MKDRIKQFIDYKGISPGDLASAMDVQRSNISHILNGRNKPGAAFIEKILIVYPDLNARWLLTGSGEMIIKENNVVNNVTDIAAQEIETDSNEDKDKEPKRKSTKFRDNSDSVGVDKLLLLYKDGTFTTYNPR